MRPLLSKCDCALEGTVEARVHALELVAAVWVAGISIGARQGGRFASRQCLPP
jgi:hypothetical protein